MRAATILILCLGLGLAAAPLAPPPAAAQTVERVSVPGSLLSLAPPPGYALSSNFSGFEHPSGASILVNELPPEATPQLAPIFATLEGAAAAFASKNVTLTKAVPLPENSELAALQPRVYAGAQAVSGRPWRKWIAAYQGERFVIVTFQAPPEDQTSEEALRDSFASVRLSAALTPEEQAAALPYIVGETGPLRRVAIIPNGASIYMIGPKDVDPEGEQPLLVIAPSIGAAPVAPGERSRFAETALRQLDDVAGLEISETAEIEIDGAPGVVIRGSGTARTGRAVRIAQWIRFADNRYLRVVAQAPEERWAEAEPAFETFIATLKAR